MMVESEVTGVIAIDNQLKQFLLVLCVSLSVAAISQMFGWFRKIPYTLLLVIVGACLAFLDVRLVSLSPGLILSIFLPPLLFEAAWNSNWAHLKEQLTPVSLYAVFGVAASVAGIAYGLTQFAGLSAATALLIGACLSATDPVSVMSLFKALGVGKTLATVMEGESLFNDGTAIVAFSFLLAFSLGQSDLAPQLILRDLLAVVGIGLGLGLLVGVTISYLTQRFDLPLVEQSLTLVAAYGAYLLAEEFGGSGVIATVAMALVLGNYGSRVGMNPRTRAIVTEFWDFIAFFVNSIVFLLIGNQIRFETLMANGWVITVTVLAMTLSRLVFVFILSWFSNQISTSNLSLSEQVVLWWSGLRGAISMALALSIPVFFPGRAEIIATVFGAVFFSLLVQGLTIQPLLSRLNLLGDSPVQKTYRETIARQAALNRALDYLQQAEDRPGLDTSFYTTQTQLIKEELTSIEQRIEQLKVDHPDFKELAAQQLISELQALEAETYAELMKAGQLNEILAPLLGDLNQAKA
ncbi:MAG: Na+/H+ antiporter [Leptolyngbyaceae cyanobacterium SM2_5_2]|nr:Na+/H+ antiporter [Leptolyngbyaceae cyanobacterium SM2_5_2]